jgi:hypothetical protein
VFEQIPEGMSPRRYAPGRGVNRKIGGGHAVKHGLLGEGANFLVYAGSARAWQVSDDALGVCKHGLGRKSDSEELTRK